MSPLRLDSDLYKAVRAGKTGPALALLDSNPNLLASETPFGSLLHIAASEGYLEMVDELLRRGIDVNRRGGVFGGAAIQLAASNGHIEVVRRLLEHGAELDVSEPERNPLFGAIYGGHLNIVSLLLSHGIDHRVKYSGKSMKGMDAMAFAHERGQLEIESFLKEYSANSVRNSNA